MPKSDGGNIWSKLLGSLREGAHELGEDWVDSRALRILDQEIRDCDVELRQSRESLAHLLARHTLAERALSESGEKIAEYETYAIKALASGEEALAKSPTRSCSSNPAAATISAMCKRWPPAWPNCARPWRWPKATSAG